MAEKNSDPAADPTPDVDLFGDELDHGRDGRGRPKLKITNETKELVAVLRAGGMERADIAAALGCSERTLRTYFLPELNEGVAAKRAEVIAAMFRQAKGGNVSAQKAFLALTEQADTVPKATLEPRPAKAQPLGKKESANIEAQSAHEGTGWGSLLN